MFALPSAVASTSAWSLAMSLFAAMAAMASSKLFSSCMRNSSCWRALSLRGIQGAELLAKPSASAFRRCSSTSRFRAALVLGGRPRLRRAAPAARLARAFGQHLWLRPGVLLPWLRPAPEHLAWPGRAPRRPWLRRSVVRHVPAPLLLILFLSRGGDFQHLRIGWARRCALGLDAPRLDASPRLLRRRFQLGLRHGVDFHRLVLERPRRLPPA